MSNRAVPPLLVSVLLLLPACVQDPDVLTEIPSGEATSEPQLDERYGFAHSVAAQGAPSLTPHLDVLGELVAQTTPDLGLEQLLQNRRQPPTFRLRAGDRIEVVVPSHTEFSGNAAVSQDGTVALGLKAPIPAVGLSTRELADEIKEQLRQAGGGDTSSVTVGVLEQAARTVKVVGRVRAHVGSARTGGELLATVLVLPPDNAFSVNDLLAQVQGLHIDADDTRLSLIVRGRPSGEDGDGAGTGSTCYHFTYRALVKAHLEGREAWVQPDDQLVVPRLPDVFVYGAVRAPGRYPLRPGTTVASLLLSSGGVEEPADEGEILVLSGEGARPAQPDEVLRADEVVFVPSSQRVYVVGEGVLRNGPLALPPKGLSVLQAVSEAGYFKPTADLGGVEIHRRQGNRRVRILVPVEDILQGRRDEMDYTLRPGDTVYVPEGLW